MPFEDKTLDELFASQITKAYSCARCNKSFKSHQARQGHELECSDELLLDEPEPVVHNIPYRERLAKAVESDPAYARYATRRNPAEPDNMSLACMDVIRNSKL